MPFYTLENAIQVRDVLFEEAMNNNNLKSCLFFMEGLVNRLAKERGLDAKSVRYKHKEVTE